MNIKEMLEIFKAEPTKLTKDELIELGRSFDLDLNKRMKEATLIDKISACVTSEEPKEIEVEEEIKEDDSKDESLLLGKEFQKTIPNHIMIGTVLIKDSIIIEQRHLNSKDFERIFKKQIEKGIFKEI